MCNCVFPKKAAKWSLYALAQYPALSTRTTSTWFHDKPTCSHALMTALATVTLLTASLRPRNAVVVYTGGVYSLVLDTNPAVWAGGGVREGGGLGGGGAVENFSAFWGNFEMGIW